MQNLIRFYSFLNKINISKFFMSNVLVKIGIIPLLYFPLQNGSYLSYCLVLNSQIFSSYM